MSSYKLCNRCGKKYKSGASFKLTNNSIGSIQPNIEANICSECYEDILNAYTGFCKD